MAIDMSLRAMETGDTDLEEDPAMMPDDDIIPDSSVLHNCNFSTETLLMACNHIVSTWFKDDLMMAQRFGHLHVDWSHDRWQLQLKIAGNPDETMTPRLTWMIPISTLETAFCIPP
jgi:hypothetical protein